MLAALDRPQTSTSPGHASRLGPPTATGAFPAAYRELCARIWIELELLAQDAAAPGRDHPGRDVTMGVVILRLELLVLVDSCRSAHWHRMLCEEQCTSLCSMLTDVLAALYVDSQNLSDGILEAQDRVLDELRASEPKQGPNPAINELLSLIQVPRGTS